MGKARELRARESIHRLQAAYTGGNKRPLENLWRSWLAIQAVPPDDPQPFLLSPVAMVRRFAGPDGAAPNIGEVTVTTATSCSLRGTGSIPSSSRSRCGPCLAVKT
jgi:hypothetical protein